MARFPIMPLFTDAMVGDTLHLTAEEFGAYCLILIATWRNNGQALPDDNNRLAHTARVSPTRWRTRLRPVLVEFFDLSSDGCWHQKRLEAEWQKIEAKSNKARKSAEERWKEDKRQDRLTFREANAEAIAPVNREANETPIAPGNPPAIHIQEATLPKNPPCLSDSESLAASAPVDKKHEGNPLSSLRSPCRNADALRLKIKRQLAVKHCRYLGAQCRWDDLAEYHDAMKAGENGLPPQELFDAIDRRMRASGWDDLRWWRELERRPRDLAPDPHSVEAMLLRQGWDHGRKAA
jgi:uncharacterized protein YdaU (DUF1376 family)